LDAEQQVVEQLEQLLLAIREQQQTLRESLGDLARALAPPTPH
jgi:hypothetical protein